MCPNIVYTGRAVADAPGVVGQGTGNALMISGAHANGSGHWGDYPARALAANAVTRGVHLPRRRVRWLTHRPQ